MDAAHVAIAVAVGIRMGCFGNRFGLSLTANCAGIGSHAGRCAGRGSCYNTVVPSVSGCRNRCGFCYAAVCAGISDYTVGGASRSRGDYSVIPSVGFAAGAVRLGNRAHAGAAACIACAANGQGVTVIIDRSCAGD